MYLCETSHRDLWIRESTRIPRNIKYALLAEYSEYSFIDFLDPEYMHL